MSMKSIGILGIGAVVAAGLSGGFATPVAAQADGLQYSNNEVIFCLNVSDMPDEKLSCIGKSAEACVNATPAGGSTIGMGGCLSRELEFWDARLNRIYRQVRALEKQRDRENAGSDLYLPSSEVALRDMQREWIPYRDARCAYEHTQWGGGTGGGPAVLACLMDVTAEQTLFLEQSIY